MRVVNNFKSYLKLLESKKIILDPNIRKNKILEKINKIHKARKLKQNISEKLLDEVVDLVESPNILVGKFDKSFLDIPKEILTTTMQKNQKYFPIFDEKGDLTNNFIKWQYSEKN